MNNDMLPVGTTVKINPEDVKWDSGDLISRDALKAELTSDTKDKYVFVCLSSVLEKIDNAPTASDRYYEGYTQGYIHGSTGAEWQGE